MSKKILKILIKTGYILVILTVICIFIIKSNQISPELDFLDIGQGDSSLIKLPGHKVILIDGGPDNLVLKRLGENIPYFHRKIDAIILSHFHDDHITGLIEVIRRYDVSSIIYMKGSKSSPLLETLLQVASQRNVKIVALENNFKIEYSQNCSLNTYNPLILKVPIDDNNSLVTKINCGKLSALFSGDNNSKVESALLKTKNNWQADILKASHHGSKTANSETFLKTIKPNILVISVGADNRFGHPNKEILDRAKALKIPIKRTDLDKTVKVVF